MKIVSALYMFIVSLCATLCCPEEDDYSTDYLEITDNTIFRIDKEQREFKIGDTIFIKAKIRNKQVGLDGEEFLLTDLNVVEGEKPNIEFQLALFYRTNFGTDVIIPVLDKDIVAIDGNLQSFGDISRSQIIVNSFFKESDFTSEFGIILREIGTFYISDAFRNDKVVELIGRNFRDISLRIRSKIVNSNDDNQYIFTVIP